MTLFIYAILGLILANMLRGIVNDIVHSVQSITSKYSAPPLVGVVEIVTASLTTVHLVQFMGGFAVQAALRTSILSFDLCCIAHHVATVLREATFEDLEDVVRFCVNGCHPSPICLSKAFSCQSV